MSCFGKLHELNVPQEQSICFRAERDEVGNQMGKEHVHGIRKKLVQII